MVAFLKSHIVRKILLLFLVSFLVLTAMKTASGQTTSTNWAGYAVNSTGITAISASWSIPTIHCGPSQGSANTVSEGVAIWIGFDGLSGVIPEQLGTDAVCYNGSPLYYAWEEDPTLTGGALSAFADTELSGGDHITASISYLGNNQIQLNIKDTTQSVSRTYNVVAKNAPRASAEWIVEVAYNINTGKLWTLPTFQPITFSDCSAAVNNVPGSLTQKNTESISMIDSNGNTIAAPQDMNQAGTSFQVAQVGSPTPETPAVLGLLIPAFAIGFFVLRRKKNST